jgi:hypothetical protein
MTRTYHVVAPGVGAVQVTGDMHQVWTAARRLAAVVPGVEVHAPVTVHVFGGRTQTSVTKVWSTADLVRE